MTCLYFNGQSIVSKLDDLHATVHSLEPDIVGITESWTNNNVLDSELNVPGYDLYRCDRPSTCIGGGVLLYVRRELQSTQFTPTSEFPEQVWCKLRSTRGKEILIGFCYKTPTSSVFGPGNDDMLRDLIQEIGGKHHVLMGDFNYPDIDWSAHSCLPAASKDSELFLDCLDDNFLSQHVVVPTRKDSILDLIISDEPDTVDVVGNLGNFANSDHDMLRFDINISVTESSVRRCVLDYAKGDYIGMKHELQTVDWDSILQPLPVVECWKTFREIIDSVESKYIPTKSVSSSKIKKPVWMTHKALKSVKRKYRVYSKYKSRDHPACVSAAKKAKTDIKNAKRNFECKLAQNIKKDKKSLFAYARSKSKVKTKVGPLVDSKGQAVTSNSEMAEEFNKSFASTFTEEDVNRVPDADEVFRGTTEETLHDVEVNTDVIQAKLSKLRTDKAPGADGMSPWLLKEIQEFLVTPIYHLMRKSLDEGTVPDDWRTAYVSPIYKKGCRDQASNYRPVSLTSQISKVIESILRDVIVEHLERHTLIRDSQHGFRKGRSCLTNLRYWCSWIK